MCVVFARCMRIRGMRGSAKACMFRAMIVRNKYRGIRRGVKGRV